MNQQLIFKTRILKEKQVFVSEVSSCTSCKNRKENIFKCNDCNILNIKIEDMQNILAKSTMRRENLNIIEDIIKPIWAIIQKIMKNLLESSFFPIKTWSFPIVKYFYCGREDHTSSICNIRKNNGMNERRKWISNDTLSITNSQWPKMIWVQKLKLKFVLLVWLNAKNKKIV